MSKEFQRLNKIQFPIKNSKYLQIDSNVPLIFSNHKLNPLENIHVLFLRNIENPEDFSMIPFFKKLIAFQLKSNFAKYSNPMPNIHTLNKIMDVTKLIHLELYITDYNLVDSLNGMNNICNSLQTLSFVTNQYFF